MFVCSLFLAVSQEHLYARLPKVTQVQLGRNDFSTFPISHPEDLANIQSLSLEHNSIGKVPLHIFTQAPNLTVVNLRDNQITSLPLDFNTWSSVTELDLGTNQIQTLPREFSLGSDVRVSCTYMRKYNVIRMYVCIDVSFVWWRSMYSGVHLSRTCLTGSSG